MPVSGIALEACAASLARAKAAGFASTSTCSNGIFRSVSPRSSARHALHHFALYTVTGAEESEEIPDSAALAMLDAPAIPTLTVAATTQRSERRGATSLV